MKRVVRIDRATGGVTVEVVPGTGVSVVIEIEQVTIAFRLDAEAARTLGGVLIQAASELDQDEERDA